MTHAVERRELECAIDLIDYWLGLWSDANELHETLPDDIREAANERNGDTDTQLRELMVRMALMSDTARAEVGANLRVVSRVLLAVYADMVAAT